MARLRGAEWERVPVDAVALVDAAIDGVRAMAERGGVTVRRHGPAEAPLRANPGPLRQAIDNLLANAIKFSPAGAAVDVTVIDAEMQLTILVEDRGPGIPAAQLEAVFAPFFRLDASRNRRTGGSGLGLFIARDLVERAGGRLSLANRDGGGLRATIVLPPAARTGPRPSAGA